MSNLKQTRDSKAINDTKYCYCCNCRELKVVGFNTIRVNNYAGGKRKNAYICSSCLEDVLENRKVSYNTTESNGIAREKRFQIRFISELNESQVAFLNVNYDIRIKKLSGSNDYSCVSTWMDCNGMNRVQKSFVKEGIKFKKLTVYGKVNGMKIENKTLLSGCKVFNNSIVKLENPLSLVLGYNLIGSYLNFQEQKYYKSKKYDNTFKSYQQEKLMRIVARQ